VLPGGFGFTYPEKLSSWLRGVTWYEWIIEAAVDITPSFRNAYVKVIYRTFWTAYHLQCPHDLFLKKRFYGILSSPRWLDVGCLEKSDGHPAVSDESSLGGNDASVVAPSCAGACRSSGIDEGSADVDTGSQPVGGLADGGQGVVGLTQSDSYPQVCHT
jgi:hypothetical protein